MPVPGSNSSPEGSFLVYPTPGGATNYQAPSYSPLTGLFYLAYSEAGAQYIERAAGDREGARNGSATRRTAARRHPAAPTIRRRTPASRRIDPETGKTVWDFKLFQGSLSNGVLATAGGVLFASSRDGNVIALDATSRPVPSLRRRRSATRWTVSGMAVAAGNFVYGFALPH